MSDEDDAGGGPFADRAVMQQAGLLRELAARLEAGEPALPTDVFGPLARELELRRDDDSIAAAYAEQGDRKAEPWVFTRGRAQG